MVSMVLPTHERAAALRDTMPSLLAVRGIDEIVVVDDASTDDTIAYVESLGDPRIRVVRRRRRGGAPAARNDGIAATDAEWIVFGEDDVRFPADYVEVLRAEAAAHDAQVVGAPWLLVFDTPLEQAVAQARASAVDRVVLDQVMRFPARPLETPFLPAVVLVHRSVFDAGVRFDPGYRGNGFREETDFFIGAMRAGFRVLYTPATYSYQLRRWTGGQMMGRARYESWVVRNNHRFLKRHGAWLEERGLVDDAARSGRRFAVGRAAYVLDWYTRAAAKRAVRRVVPKR
jgi:glycosyltransferase involved in cell wall biosynthesis